MDDLGYSELMRVGRKFRGMYSFTGERVCRQLQRDGEVDLKTLSYD
jgi:hypothetical protein